MSIFPLPFAKNGFYAIKHFSLERNFTHTQDIARSDAKNGFQMQFVLQRIHDGMTLLLLWINCTGGLASRKRFPWNFLQKRFIPISPCCELSEKQDLQTTFIKQSNFLWFPLHFQLESEEFSTWMRCQLTCVEVTIQMDESCRSNFSAKSNRGRSETEYRIDCH